MKILIVEDHVESARALDKLLTEKFQGQAECFVASNLVEGLKLNREFNIDITLLDLCLPDASIEEVILSIRRFSQPVIIVTSISDENHDLEIKCYENYAQNFFTKEELREEIYNNMGASLVSSVTKSFYREYLPKIREEREKRKLSK